jgi:hypothetical protein
VCVGGGGGTTSPFVASGCGCQTNRPPPTAKRRRRRRRRRHRSEKKKNKTEGDRPGKKLGGRLCCCPSHCHRAGAVQTRLKTFNYKLVPVPFSLPVRWCPGPIVFGPLKRTNLILNAALSPSSCAALCRPARTSDRACTGTGHAQTRNRNRSRMRSTYKLKHIYNIMIQFHQTAGRAGSGPPQGCCVRCP